MPRWSVTALLLALLVGGVAGCGPTPPAERTDPLPTNRFPSVRPTTPQR